MGKKLNELKTIVKLIHFTAFVFSHVDTWEACYSKMGNFSCSMFAETSNSCQRFLAFVFKFAT